MVRANADGFFGVGLPGVQVSPALVQFMIGQCLDCSARAASAFCLTAFTTDLRAEMRAISLPALIIHGEHDRQAPLEICGRTAAQLIPGSTLVTYADAAHGLFITHAHRLNADLLAFARPQPAAAIALAHDSRADSSGHNG